MEKMEKRNCIFKYDHVPDEIWLEILSRMPIKSLLVSRAVCKSWNTMAVSLRNKIRRLPLCGLILFDFDSYFCLRNKEVLVKNFGKVESPDELTVMSGYDKGWLGNLSFDFSALFNQNCFYCVSRGLLLLSLDDGTYLVHNPATKERFLVPKSPMAQKHSPEKSNGAIIRLFDLPLFHGFFVVVRLFCQENGNHVEYFTSWTGKWFRHMNDLHDDQLRYGKWSFDNYVPLNINRRLMVFFLTDRDYGVVIKLKTRDDPMVVHSFALPQNLYMGYDNARLGDLGGFLYLSYSTIDELRIWKYNDYGGLAEANDAWIPLVGLSNTEQLHQLPVRRHRLPELFKASEYFVVILGFHVDRPVVFILAHPIIYAYNLAADTLDKIAEIKDENRYELILTYPFTPFFGPLNIPRLNSE